MVYKCATSSFTCTARDISEDLQRSKSTQQAQWLSEKWVPMRTRWHKEHEDNKVENRKTVINVIVIWKWKFLYLQRYWAILLRSKNIICRRKSWWSTRSCVLIISGLYHFLSWEWSSRFYWILQVHHVLAEMFHFISVYFILECQKLHMSIPTWYTYRADSNPFSPPHAPLFLSPPPGGLDSHRHRSSDY